MPESVARPPRSPAQHPAPAPFQQPDSGRAPAPLRAAIWVFATLFALSLAGMVYLLTSVRPAPTGGSAQAPIAVDANADSVPDEPLAVAPGFEQARFVDLALIDQDGKPFTNADLEGRVTVAAFFFTHCPLACPRMTAEMARAAAKLRGSPVRFVSFSLDPVHDRPEDLRGWAARFKADTGQWRFVTEPDGAISEPAQGVIAKMLRATWNLEVAPVTGQQLPTRGGEKTTNLVHPTELYLIGPTGRVLGRYPTSPNAPAGQIESLVQHALAAVEAMNTAAR